MEMKRLYEQAVQLATELQRIADNISEYNPGLCKKKVPLEIIQYDVASLAKELAGLHEKIGEKIKNGI